MFPKGKGPIFSPFNASMTNNFFSEFLIQISTVNNEELVSMTHISKIEQDPTVDECKNG
jgi:hypothetical protein